MSGIPHELNIFAVRNGVLPGHLSSLALKRGPPGKAVLPLRFFLIDDLNDSAI